MPKSEDWEEPDMTINGHELTFGQAMTTRVALISFRMFLSTSADEMGEIGRNYRDRLKEIFEMMKPAASETPSDPPRSPP